jgi:hypothetical protein
MVFVRLDVIIKRCYITLMKEHLVEDVVIKVSVVSILAVLLCSLIAPVLGPWFRARKVRAYALHPDWKRRVRADMTWVYVGLTIWAIIAWTVLLALS